MSLRTTPENRYQCDSFQSRSVYDLKFQGGDTHVESLNDVANFKHVKEALSIIEFTEEEQNALFAIIASVIHLGTIGFLDPEIEHGEVKLENGRPVNVVSKVQKMKT